MRILLVTHYFPPEIGAPQARLSETARAWAHDGDHVTVLTGMPNHPTGVVHREYRGRLRCVEQVDDYEIVRTWLYATANEGIVRKTLSHLSFMVTSVLLGWKRTGRPDVVVVSSPTFFSIFSAWLLARAKRARFVVEVRDLWPAIFVELGVLKQPLVIRMLEALEMAAYRAADEVIVVSDGFRDNIVKRGISPQRVHTIRNGATLARFEASADPETRRKLNPHPDDVLVLYIGAHGISHGLDAVLRAAALTRGKPIHYALVGEGAAKRDLARLAHAMSLDNVTMLPGVPSFEVPSHIAAADICLVPLRDVPLFSTFIPSKMFEYLAAGKAVVGAVRGEPAQILSEAGAIVVPPGDEDAMACAIVELAADTARRQTMGRVARDYVTEHFDRTVLAGRYRKILADAVERTR